MPLGLNEGPTALGDVVLLAGQLFAAEAELTNLEPAVQITEAVINFLLGLLASYEVRHVNPDLESEVNVGLGMGREVSLGDFEGFIAGHLLSPFDLHKHEYMGSPQTCQAIKSPKYKISSLQTVERIVQSIRSFYLTMHSVFDTKTMP
jgi:hypothetical protein